MQYRHFGKGDRDFVAVAWQNGPLTRPILH